MDTKLGAIVDRDGVKSLWRLFRVTGDDELHQIRGKRLLLVFAALTALGAVAWLVAFQGGHHVMGTTSEVPWGILIATYVFFVATSTGVSLVASLGHVFGVQALEPLARRATLLALVTLLAGFVVIASELERPFLLLVLAIVSPNPASPIWWMGALYGMVTVVIALDLYFLLVDNHRMARLLGIVGVVLEVAANSNLGAVFALNHARPFWYGAFVPVYFISTALVSGAALLILMVYATDYFTHSRRLRPENHEALLLLQKLLSGFLLVMAFFTVWRFIVGIQGSHYHRSDVANAHLTGPLFVSFWLVEVFLGFVVPLYLLLGPKRRSAAHVAVAAVLPLAAMFVARFNFVYSGQMLSQKPLVGRLGESFTYAPPFKGNVAGVLPYTPSLVEMLIVAGAVGFAVVLFVVGSRALRLGRQGQST